MTAAAAPLARCYHAAYQPAPRAYHLLLADLRATHGNGFQVAPNLELARATADAIARLHARAPELRREWQLPALWRYQEVLGRAGVELAWPLLLDDYRLAALESVQIAVE